MTNATPRQGEGTIILDDDDSATVRKVAVRLPVFWPEEPELWFAQLEGQFTICGITDDDTRYAYVLSRIEPQQAREIRDVIKKPPSTAITRASTRQLRPP